MSQPFKVDFLFKLCQFTVGCCVSQVTWKYVLCIFVWVFLWSSSILMYICWGCLSFEEKNWCRLQFMTIRPPCIFKKIQVVFHFKRKLMLSFIFKKIEVVFYFQKNRGRLPFKKKDEVVIQLKEMRSSFIFEYLRSSSIVIKLMLFSN